MPKKPIQTSPPSSRLLIFPSFSPVNFGEIRANHFHGGLDFKTGGAIGKPVRALADGYISRIRVTHGSGYVLDVVYDNAIPPSTVILAPLWVKWQSE